MPYFKYDGTPATETAATSNSFYANAASQTLTGTSGPDALWASGGGDTLIGGAGDDTYYLQSAGNQISEQAGAGVDKIISWSNVSLTNFPNVENLDQNGDGVYGAGNSGDNILTAGAGRVELYGNGGQDVLVAGTGQDTFDIIKGTGNDAIYGFKPAGDIVRLSAGFTDFAQVQAHMTQVGADVKIDLGGSDGLIIRNTQVSQLTAANFELQVDPSKIGQMTFHDEFNGTSASIWDATYNPTGTWRPDYGYQGPQGAGSYTLSGNNEQQIYTSPYFRGAAGDHASPFTEANGQLTITAAPTTAADNFGYGYTSGMISTKESFAQTYGYFEMRAELPHGNGGWPAFWLVDADGTWPPELDVMETLTGDGHVDYTTEHTMQTGTHTSQSISSYIPDTTDGFHTYGVLWTKSDLVWYVDGVEVFHTATPTDMNKPMYMIANLALGGWSGAIDNSQMPEQMKIDYIRSYALADGSTTVQGFDSGQASGNFSSTVSPPASGSGTSVSPPPVSPPPVSPPPVSPPPPADPGTTTTTSPPPPPSATTSTSSDGQVFTSHGGDTLTGTAGADTFNAGAAPTTLTGGAGADHFAFSAEPWAPTHITDFKVGEDVLDLTALLKSAGYTGSDPVADHYVTLQSDGNGGTEVLFDPDGAGTAHQWPDYVINLDHTVATTWAQLQGAGATSAPTSAVSPPPVSPPPVSPPPVSPPPATTGQVFTSHGGDTLTGTAGADTFNAGAAPATLTGGAGADHFVFSAEPWAPTHITDFKVGEDVLDISALLKSAGYAGTDPVADHYVILQSDGNGGTEVLFDPDGTATAHQWPDYMINLDNTVATTWAQLQGATGSTSAPAPASPPPPPVTTGVVLTSAHIGDTLTGGAGADTLNASQGNDILTGGAGNDLFVFQNEPWSPDTVTDFQEGHDKLDLRGIFAKIGYNGTDPVADHHLVLASDGHGGTAVEVDDTGSTTGNPWPNYVIDLQHVDPSTLTSADWIIR